MVNLYLTPLKSKPEKTSFNQEAIVALSCVSKMTAKAVLLCRPNSHPFQERTLLLDQPVKVGRSVARARPAQNNGIFDCKVLSRNHALLWYENGKFFLQDTKSSNGTFVNNQRLSKGSDESPPREVCSGDIVQFGVDVMENSRKVTHGCIVATLKLFLPDGKEAKASPSTVMLPTCPSTIAQQDLYQLAQYLQEALHREQVLQDKISTLQKVVKSTEESADSSWKALIDEDRLLTRLEILESQLRSCSKNFSEDALREEVVRLQEDKDRYQVTSKESLKKVLQENMEVAHKLQDVERILSNSETECKNLKQVYESTQNEIKELAEKYDARLKEIQDLNEKLLELESKNTTTEKDADEVEKKPSIIISDYCDGELTVKKAISDNNISLIESQDEVISPLRQTQGVQVDLIISENDKEDPTKEPEIESADSKSKLADLNSHCNESEKDLLKSRSKVAEINTRLAESKTTAESSTSAIQHLLEKIELLERELNAAKASKESPERLTVVYRSDVEPTTPTITLPLPGKRGTSGRKSSENHNGEVPFVSQTELQTEISRLSELLQAERDIKRQAETDIKAYKFDLEEARIKVKKGNEDSTALRLQLQTAQQQTAEKTEVVNLLRDQLKQAESSQVQLNSLKDRLSADEQRYIQKQEEVDSLRQQLSEVLHNYKQAHNEAEQLRNKVETLLKQLEVKSSDSQETLDGEYLTLRKSYQLLEAEINHVKSENIKLRESFKVVSQNESQPDSSLTEDSSTQEDVEITKRKLLEAYAQIVNLKETCDAYNDERSRLRRELDNKQEFRIVQFLVPLIVVGILYYVLHW